MTKSDRSHVLVDYELGILVAKQEADSQKRSVDTALEVAEFVRVEGEWLRRERDRLAEVIDREAEHCIYQVQRYAVEKKQELDRLLQHTIEALEVFKTTERRAQVIETKNSRKHLRSLVCVFQELQLEKLIELQVQGFELAYQIAPCPYISNFNWPFQGHIDAISFKTSKEIELTGVSLCKGERKGGLVLRSLAILKGRTTTSQVLYSDSEVRFMDSDHPYKVDVQLQKNVSIVPNAYYTIKVQLMGCYGVSSGKMLSNEQDGLRVTFSNTSFNGSEASNGSRVDAGIFYELLYSCLE